jgi:hypothetical protein
MDLRVEPGRPYFEIFRDRAGALHSPTKVVTLGTRCAAAIAICLALLTGCGSGTSAGVVTFTPNFIPIVISVARDGSVEVSVSPSIATPIGTFSLTVPVESFSSHYTLLVIRHLVHFLSGVAAHRGPVGANAELVRYDPGSGSEASAGGTWVDDVIEIRTIDKLLFQLDGGHHLTPEGNIAILKISNEVSGIRIKDYDADPTVPRFAAELVTTLKTPPGMTAPAARPATWPTPSITTCKPIGSDGTVTCAATVTGGTGTFTYRWFDGVHPIGSGNPIRATLPVGDRLLTVTATGSNGTAASSPYPVTVRGSQGGTTPPTAPASSPAGGSPAAPASSPAGGSPAAPPT